MKEQIIEIIKNDKGFMGDNNFKIIELNKDECILEYKIKNNGLNPYGIVHGGLLFGLADSACGLLATMNEKKCVTTSANINYIKVANGKKIVAYATCIKSGNNICYYSVNIKDENNELVANANINYYYLKK